MDFELSDEQLIFQRMIRDFVATHIRPVAREWEHAGRYPDEIVEVMKVIGLFGLTIPEEYGGQGLDMVSLAIVFEEISKAWMGIAGIIGSHSLACLMIARHGTDDQKRRLLPELATGQRRTGIGLTEPSGGSDLQGISARAWRDGDHYVVRGTKMWITNARHANPLPVLVKTDPDADPRHRGMSILLVEQGLPGYTVTRDLGKLGYKGPETCEVVLDDVRVPVDCLLGGVEGRGLQQALSALECGRINIAARAVGVAAEATDAALRYTNERHAFGQPIAQFQAVQLKLADMATSVQAARLMTYWAATKLDSGQRADVETGMAKLFASETAVTCALDSMRLHGAYGYSTELDIERLYRDAPLMAIGEGTNDILRTVIARGLSRQLDD
ncbi:MAG TPA: acyl-CoA dehydrogenase family protein [Acidimicrobiales bacterium]|nr:acyl-CoA dehydrogenase family protein [Acidimicrobiales bacterium]